MINIKSIAIAACLLVASLAFGQTDVQNNSAAGKGLAKNRENAAKFELRAFKGPRGDVKANFSATVGGEDSPNRVNIELKRAGDLNFRPDAAILTGAAVLTVKNGSNVRRIEGRIEVTVVDVVHPNQGDEGNEDLNKPHDRIIIRFRANQGDTTYSFEGLVVRGDIKVGHIDGPQGGGH
ncbi:MAG: hypothetical protein ACKVQS_10425 [Fimbriimonadaceae bacterium]